MRVFKPAAALLLFVSLICVAQTQCPYTPAGHQLSGWLENFNRGDREALKDFLQKNYPSRAGGVDRQLEFRQRSGGFDLKKVEESTPTKVVALVQEACLRSVCPPDNRSTG
jgi:hypothetical protein